MAGKTDHTLAIRQQGNPWEALSDLISTSEDWLMLRILHYAQTRRYAKYTSTLKEAWRLSISGLSASLLVALRNGGDLELDPDDDYTEDPVASFGIVEARRHRERGVDLSMFLGLMKYYRQSYTDLVRECGFDQKYENRCRLVLERFFDRVEIGFCTEWASSADNERIRELQVSNRAMTNEKNKYLTIFESQPNPVILLDKNNRVDNLNHAAAVLFQKSSIPGAQYYCMLKDRHKEELDGKNSEGTTCFVGAEAKKLLPWMAGELKAFVSGDNQTAQFEKQFPSQQGVRYYGIKVSQMLDVSGKFGGTVVNLEDLSVQREANRALKESEEKYRNLVDNSLVGVFKTNLKGDVVYVNHALAKALQFDSPEAVIAEGVLPRYKNLEDREVLIERLRKSHRVTNFEVELVTKEGKTIGVILNAVLFGDTISGMIMDITQRKRTEDELRLANQKILEQQKAVIEEERLKVLLQMAGATAHELNQPLTVLLGNVDLMRADLDDREKTSRYLANIESSGMRMSEIVKKIENIRHYQTKPYVGRHSIINFDQEVFILSIEDSLGDFETIKGALNKFKQIRLSWAKTIKQALEAMESRPFDMVFLDHDLPDGNSQDLLGIMKSKGIEIPVVVVSGQGDEMTASQIIQAGAYDYLPKDMVSVESLSRSISNALEKSRLKKEITVAQQRMKEMSKKDDLTGLFKRPYLMETLERAVARAGKRQSRIVLCMIDLDSFRQVNNAYGHATGDMVLKKVSRTLKRCFGDKGLAGRWDGAKFAIVLPDTLPAEAFSICETFREKLANREFEYGVTGFHITTSIGVASYDPVVDPPAVELLKVANHALDEAKRAGRNRVVEYVHRGEKQNPRLGDVWICQGYVNEGALGTALSEQKMRLGEILVQAGRLTMEQLNQALNYQKTASKRLGEILTRLGYSTAEDIGWALKKMKRKLGEIARDNGLITDHELQRSLVLQQYEPRRLR